MATDPRRPTLDARTLARLATTRRTALGAAHSLNNAFTAAIGEATFLLGERKDDAEIVECCQLILEAMERSTRITRGMLARRGGADGAPGESETDLGRLLTELAAFLRETLGRSHPLELELPETWLGVSADPADLDLVLTTLFQFAADASGDQSCLHASLEDRSSEARLTVQVRSCEHAAAASTAVNDPALSDDALTRAGLIAVRELIGACGGDLYAETTAPDAWAFVLVLPAITEDADGR